MDMSSDICCPDAIHENVVRTDLPLSSHSDFHPEIRLFAKKIWPFPFDFEEEKGESDHRVLCQEQSEIFDFLDFLVRERFKEVLYDIDDIDDNIDIYVKSVVFENREEDDERCILKNLNICIGICMRGSGKRRISGCYCAINRYRVVLGYNTILLNFLSWIKENYPDIDIYQNYKVFKKRPDFEFLKFHIQSNYRYLMRSQFLIKSGLSHFSETEEYPPLNR